MPKLLYLLRHAEALDAPNDFERPLSSRGQAHAEALGKRLAAKEFKPDVFLASPARRAQTTATLVGKALGVAPEPVPQLYEASVQSFMLEIQELDDVATTAFVVAHNPAIPAVVSLLSHHSVEQLPPCGLVWLRLDVKRWEEVLPGCGHFQGHDFP